MKRLICFDVESTGVDPATDRIVQIAWKCDDDAAISLLVNPCRPIPAESTEVHGITDEMVEHKPTFQDLAPALHEVFRRGDLLGFNISNFDVPLLWEEFYRSQIVWDLSENRILDAGTLFKRREQRTLAAALQFYCAKTLEGAHNALNDVNATMEVWHGQLLRYGLVDADRETLERESNYEEKRVDLAGKIVTGKDGRPAYAIGKSKGVAVADDASFARWMLGKDFSANTKIVVSKILDDIYDPYNGH